MVVAVVQISESNLVGENVTNNVTNLNIGSADAVNLVVASNTIIATENSFEKWTRIRCDTIEDSNKIDNFKFWMTPATAETGITYLTNAQNPLANDAFATPVATTSTIADVAMPTSVPGSENIGVSGGSGGLTADNTFSDYCVIQVQVTGAADPGDLLQKTFHYQYDEQ